MRQSWHRLLFLHWRVPAAALRPLIPAELEIDTFEGDAFVGLVPFTMTGVRPPWAPSVPGLSAFHEINVRTYVHHSGRNPGVWFFSLDAANAIAVRLARLTWKLPYHFARMSLRDLNTAGADLSRTPSADGCDTEYVTERLWPGPLPAACSVRYGPSGAVRPATAGTLEHFLLERYLLYTADRHRIFCGQVHHAAYPAQTAQFDCLSESLVCAAGIQHGPEDPIAHYANRVDVRIYPLRPVCHRAGVAEQP